MRQEVTVIESSAGGLIKCEVECAEACGSCKAKSVCGTATSKKTIDLFDTTGQSKVGDRLIVEVGNTMGLRAVLIAYILPLVVLFAVMITLRQLEFEPLTYGLSGIGAMVLYFIAIKVFSIGKSVTIEIIERISNN